MFREITLILFIAIIVLMTGCASGPPVIDLSESVYKVGSANQSERKKIGNLRIINKADDGKSDFGFLSNTIMQIKPATPTSVTIEQDLKLFFENTVSVDKTASQDLTVTISKADSYYVVGGVSQITFIGFALVGIDREFGINLRILFEIEKKGKVTAQYLFDEKITIQGKTATQGAIIQSYQMLIAEYRTRFFGEIETRFFDRYF
jgi:hypothetical protein